MSEYLILRDNVIHLESITRISINSGKVFDQLVAVTGSNMAAESRLKRLSARDTLVIWCRKDYCYISSDGIIYCCKVNMNNDRLDWDGLTVVGVSARSFRDQTMSMTRGVFFDSSAGIHISVNMRGERGISRSWFRGFDDDGDVRTANVKPSLWQISSETIKKAEEIKDDSDESFDESEDYEPSEGLASMLETAEAYSRIEGNLEETKAQQNKDKLYTGIDTLEQTDRNDRVMYRFFVDALDETIFTERSQVTIYDKTGDKHNAEIVTLVRDDDDSPVKAFDAMFNEQVNIDSFNSVGKFELTFNPVSMNVQLEAQQKIAEGKAAAKYMDDVLGKWEPKGFVDNDLIELRKNLSELEYPPNESQEKAILEGINSKDAYLVMGPPGTGKTTVIVQWVKYFVSHGMRVLVSSQNNKAVDNVLVKMRDEPQIETIRIGSELKMQDNVKCFMFEKKIEAIREEVAEKANHQIENIEEILSSWTDYVEVLKQFTAYSDEEKQSKEALEAHVREAIVPNYLTLKKCLEDYQNLCREESVLVETLREDMQWLANYEHKNFLLKLLGRRRNSETIMSVDVNLVRYRKLRIRKQELIHNYRSVRESYEDACSDAINNNYYYEYRTKRRKVEETIQLLRTMPDETGSNPLNLFRNVRSIAITDAHSVAELKTELQKEIRRCTSIRNTLARWSDAVGLKQNYFLSEMVLDAVDVVGATCIGINSQRRFSSMKFDVTIIDEAGQIQIHNALVPMSVSNKLIMLGDHKQIPPIVSQELESKCNELGVDTELLRKSLFEKMYENLPDRNKLMLDTQYRMPAEIAQTISDWFYDGKYKSFEKCYGRSSLVPALSKKTYILIDTSEAGSKRFEAQTDTDGTYNELEARIIEHIVLHLMKSPQYDPSQEGNGFDELGIISAYSSQVALIKEILRRHISYDIAKETVATLDSFQGQERDIIIYSFTRSSGKNPKYARIGFLKELRRLNVAMSRCKKTLIMIGDFSFLSSCQHCFKDEYGEEIMYGSEREFSHFIQKILQDVNNGAGELINYREFKQRLQ